MAIGGELLGRTDEMHLASQVLQQVSRDGNGAVVLFEGPAGIGKTSLLASIRAEAATGGYAIANARGIDLEQEYAWGLVRQLFSRAEPPSADAAMPPSAASPAVSSLLAGVLDAAGHQAPQGEYALLNSLFWLTSDRASNSALLLVADDLHWSDTASLRFLAYLAARLDGLPIALVGALRPGDRRIEPIVSAIADCPHATIRTLQPLGLDVSTTLLASMLPDRPDDDVVVRCHELTRGNPLLLCELGRELARADRPDAVAEVLDGRVPSIARYVRNQLHRLPALARTTIQALSVLGDRSSVDSLAAVADLPAADVLGALSALLNSELVSGSGLPELFSISHPLVRAAVYDDMTVADRVARHALAARAAMNVDDVERAAAHVLRLPSGYADVDAVAVLGRAAQSCLARGAVDGAVTYLQRQLEEDVADDRQELLTQLGMVEILVDAERGRNRLATAFEQETDPEGRAEIALGVVGATFYCGKPVEALSACTSALAQAEELSVSARRSLQSWAVLLAFINPVQDELLELLDDLSTLPSDASLGGLMLDGALALHDAFRCRPHSAVTRGLRAIAGDTLVAHPVAESPLSCAWTTLLACDAPEVLPSIDAAITRARETGSLRALAPATCYRSGVMLARGDLDEALSDGRQAWEAANTSVGNIGLPFVAGYLVQALVFTGHLDEAESVMKHAEAVHPPGMPRFMYADSATCLLLAQGDVSGALDAAYQATWECEAHDVWNPMICDWRSHLVQCLHLQGRDDEARPIATEARIVAAQLGTARAMGRSLRVAATVETGDRRTELLTESVRVLDGSTARYEHALSRYALGEALRHSRRLAEARTELQSALELAETCGAGPLMKAAEQALRLAGARRSTLATRGPAALTTGETRVVELAAGGWSNREIAQHLFVTVKTVEVHLGNAFRKLGIGRRQDLARAME